MSQAKHITVAGAGLVGSMLTVMLARRGHKVDLFDGLPDSRQTNIYQGRSINLALSSRGLKALEVIGMREEVLQGAIPMYQRVIHALDGSLTYQSYGKPDEAIYSVSRARINQQLMTLAEQESGTKLHFEHRLNTVDFDTTQASFTRTDHSTVEIDSDYIFAADGANSKVRRLMQERPRVSHSLEYMPMSYIELNISANPDGSHKLPDVEALHIWSRGEFMLIALPNTDGSFTCTLFLNYEGEISFKALQTESQIQHFFETHFADVLPILDTPVKHFQERTPSPLALVDVYPWVQNNTCLIGDSCHAIVPFYGQGMNAGFEDCRVLNELMDTTDDWHTLLNEFQQTRKPDAEAIAILAKENFVEMSDLTSRPEFLLRKKIEQRYSDRYPERWTPLYSMVTFSPDVRYSHALAHGRKQAAIMDEIMAIPNIEEHWQEDFVYDRISELVALSEAE